ncbi:Cellobiose 2-epimerase [Porphyromonas levii]|uniref:AGE family epimerase/isomerase n=1 Tax=Porphyromonas levii TaxID=28114 RepID=UPI001BAA85A9|nr:AGE family epimerase/isomerase [Porphyromonas levii]MBR8763586.1 Cellobiose 2-epimerase [Porphyromonas levii]MBR8764863.1 Cellobiose 2-epimerase [Porphyromonas levii]
MLDFAKQAQRYRSELTGSLLPFWLKHGLDREFGGMLTCLDRDGVLMDETKSVWFQGRSAFTFAYAYNNVAQRPEYLEASKQILDFMEQYCFDPKDGRMYFEVKRDGTPLRKRRYVFSESFAIIAWAEYAKATGDKSYAEKALNLFFKVQQWLATPGMLEPKYLPSLEAVGHSITMIMLNVAVVLSQVTEDERLAKQVEESFRLIKDKLYQPKYNCVLEMVTPEGEMIDTLNGRVINPGHCIETAWFLMEASRLMPNLSCAKEMRDFSTTILDDAWKWGWDEVHGGIINFRDCKGFPAQDYSQDMKFWWPQTEAQIATLYAYILTGDEKYVDWYQKVDDWAWKHLKDKEYPEWYGYLHRDGTVAQPAKGNIFKGPFHIPRMLVKASLLCDEITTLRK